MSKRSFLSLVWILTIVIIVKCEDSVGALTDPLSTAESNQTTRGRKVTISNDPKDIHFFVYSDTGNVNTFQEVKIGDVESLERSKMVPGKVIILVDGWMDKDTHVKFLKDGYLSQGICNIVILHYYDLNSSDLPFPFFLTSYFGGLNNIPKIGKRGAEFIHFLYKNKIISGADQVHIVGFSLGAHVSGSIGLMTKKKYKMRIGRITGLDPAGPFTKFLKANRLNKSQAIFVDAIHTDIDVLGTSSSVGHADFFINGGLAKNIPGCEKKDPIFQHGCAHIAASVLYYKTIIKENTFIGCSCGQVPAKRVTSCGNLSSCKTPTIVGENCPPGARGEFFVKTSVDISSKL